MNISHNHADAPYKAAGLLAQTARDTVADMSRQAEKALPVCASPFLQLTPPAKR